MPTPPANPSVRDVERAFLRKSWWAFPVAGALASLAVGGPFWNWVDAQPVSIQWEQLLGWRAAWWGLAFLVIPAVWGLGWRLPIRRGWVWALALVFLVGAELVLRSSLAQTSLWLAARARLAAGQHFMREVCYVRLEETAGRQTPSPAVILVGSSQVLNGVDVGLLRELLKPMPVIRRAVFGMTPLKALSMQAYMPFRPGDVCVMYLSEFDFTNQDEFPFAWFRPYASWRTLPEVMRCISWAVKVRHWRQVADYAMAGTFEWWRARDFLQQIVLQTGGPESKPRLSTEVPDPAAMAAKARATLQVSPAEQNAFRTFAHDLSRRQVAVVVFEGDVNPAIHSPSRLQAKAQTRNFLSELSAANKARYVSLEEQGLALSAEHWSDMSHLNAVGRDLLTRRLARELSTR